MGRLGQLATNAVAGLTIVLATAATTPLFFAGCSRTQPLPSSQSPAPESANAPAQIWGVSALAITSNSISVTKATTGAGGSLKLLVDGRSVTGATLSVGDVFLVTDGRHVSRSFRLIEIDQGWAVFRVKERLNLASFGDRNRESTQTHRFAVYSK